MPKRVVFVDIANDVMDNGVDNPFRPGSELSREADIIVNLIKEGKPITPTKDTADSPNFNEMNGEKKYNMLEKSEMNGTSKNRPPPQEVIPVMGIVVPPNDSQVVEEVNIKKKRKCCVVQ